MQPSEAGSPEIAYTRRVTAVVDVLGFSELVVASAHDRAKMEKVRAITSLFTTVERDHYDIIEDEAVDISFFSDTVIVSARAQDSDGVWRGLRETGKLAFQVLSIGLPCRGGVATDLCHHSRNLIVGPAVVRANYLEKSVAIYPRIVLDEVTVDHWRQILAAELAPDEWREAVKCDRDGVWYLNIFHQNFVGGLPWSSLPSPRSDVLAAVHGSIARGLEQSKRQPRVRAKYKWLEGELVRSNCPKLV